MEPAQALSEAVMDVLKEFSQKGLPLHCAGLREIFAAREEIVSLLAPDIQANTKEQKPSTARGESCCAMPQVPVSPDEVELKELPELREAFLSILDGLAAAIKGEYERRFSLLQEKICECQSLMLFGEIGKQVGIMVGEIINRAVEDTDYSNDFLFELSRDLYQMEQQLSIYQEFNNEGSRISNEFYTDILSHATDIHDLIGTNNSKSNISKMIFSKIMLISLSIEEKRRCDEVRAIESDVKINELQNSLKAYEKEILQIRKRSESLEKEVLLDELTKISNRRSYDLHIKECLREYRRTSKRFSLILIDIDHFKIINDNYGHKAGDKCLHEIAQRIKSALRESDFFARYGGEELIAILHGCDSRSAQNVAEKIRHRIENTRFYYHDETMPVTISLGVTEVMPSDTEPEAPFIRVDEAMYRAKKEGRNKVCCSSGSFVGSPYNGGLKSVGEESIHSLKRLGAGPHSL